MLVSDAVDTIVSILQYVLPAAFIWAITDRIVRSIIKAATGRSKNGL